MGVRRPEITVMMKDGTAQVILATVVNKIYGIHRSINHKSKFWAITHIPTGLLVTLEDSADKAKTLAQILPVVEEPTEEYIAAVAQLVEQSPCKREVESSSLSGGPISP